jgi:hypothetical protein
VSAKSERPVKAGMAIRTGLPGAGAFVVKDGGWSRWTVSV